MTNKEYVNTLKYIASLPTVYCNKFPKNLGYWDGSKFSFDCWNLIKSVIDGWKDCRQIGYYVHPLKPTGDIDGATILKKCTVKSKDFKQISVPGTYLYMKGHSGTYIGETTINGKLYNVIECTASWTKNVLYSWVDNDGTRRQYKGGKTNGKWTDWGLMCWIDYGETNNDPTSSVKPSTSTYMYSCANGASKVDFSPVFDSAYYAKNNADVVKVFGTKDTDLFKHFTQYGMNECRKGNEAFDPKAYANANPDVKAAYGSDWKMYYDHYCRFGKNEGRKLK